MTNPNLSNRSTELISKGIAYVNDLLSNSGDRLGYYDFIERYQIKINFVDFYSLTHSLPSHWLKSGKTQQKEGEMKLTFLLVLGDRLDFPCRCSYRTFVTKLRTFPIMESKCKKDR